MNNPSTPVATEQMVGEAIRKLRDKEGLSVRGLAARAGFSPSFLSQLENGQVSPSIHSLQKIVGCLGLTLGGFFSLVEPRESQVSRASERLQFSSGWSKAGIESLAAGALDVPLEPILVTLAEGGSSAKHAEPQTFAVFVFILDGEMTLTLGDEEFVLGPGDSAIIPPGQPHKFQNKASFDTRVLIVSSVSSEPTTHG